MDRIRVLAAASGGAVLLNLATIFILTQLARERPRPVEFREAIPVRLVRLTRPEQEEVTRSKPPDPPKPETRLDFTPDLFRPSLARFPAPDVGVVIDPGRFDAPPVSDYIFDMSDVDEQPVPLVQTQPIYPPRPLSLGIEGKVVVRFLVMADGTVRNIEIVEASPKGYFEEAVLKAASKWRFRPGRVRGRPVNSWWTRDIDFKLQP